MVWEIGMELIMHLNNLMHLPLALEPSAALSLVCKTLSCLILGLFPHSTHYAAERLGSVLEG